MKKLAVVIGMFSLFLIGCDNVLSVVTVNENGENISVEYILRDNNSQAMVVKLNIKQ